SFTRWANGATERIDALECRLRGSARGRLTPSPARGGPMSSRTAHRRKPHLIRPDPAPHEPGFAVVAAPSVVTPQGTLRVSLSFELEGQTHSREAWRRIGRSRQTRPLAGFTTWPTPQLRASCPTWARSPRPG